MKEYYEGSNSSRIIKFDKKKVKLFLFIVISWSVLYTLIYYRDSLILRILVCLNAILFITITILLKIG